MAGTPYPTKRLVEIARALKAERDAVARHALPSASQTAPDGGMPATAGMLDACPADPEEAAVMSAARGDL